MPQTYRTSMARSTPILRVVLVGSVLALAGCATLNSAADKVGGLFTSSAPAIGSEGAVQGFLGNAVADEPQAALTARTVLSAGGNAIDAAVAASLVLTVTLPSRAGLGGGGACLVFPAGNDSGPQAILFPAGAPRLASGDRPAAVPMMARGLFAMHARYGTTPFEGLITPAEQLARFGMVVSRAFARDLAVVGRALAADPAAAAIFFRGGTMASEGTSVIQPDLGSTLAQLRVAGSGDFYQGALARRMALNAPLVGASLTLEDLKTALPRIVPPLLVPSRFGSDQVAFLPAPADGGRAAAAFQSLARDPAAAPAIEPDALPASTSLVTMDNAGNAVACAFSMNNLFGIGRFLPETGVLLAASPGRAAPQLSAAIAFNPSLKSFRAAVASSGQNGAAVATASAMAQTLATGQPMAQPVPEPGRANVIACAGYLPGREGTCAAATDPRGAGLVAGSN